MLSVIMPSVIMLSAVAPTNVKPKIILSIYYSCKIFYNTRLWY
jgi:hypothetical protein